jgi:hypothetical protein
LFSSPRQRSPSNFVSEALISDVGWIADNRVNVLLRQWLNLEEVTSPKILYWNSPVCVKLRTGFDMCISVKLDTEDLSLRISAQARKSLARGSQENAAAKRWIEYRVCSRPHRPAN